MDRYFPKILRDYISKQKRKNLSVFSNKSFSLSANPASDNISIGPGNGRVGVCFLNKLLFRFGLKFSGFIEEKIQKNSNRLGIFTIAGPHGGGGGAYFLN